ncbi:MAG TPA: ABC transporter permease [Gemmatimonadales bacterium]|nr:ABC transporter permease [Gemmatimonadales bacterium]
MSRWLVGRVAQAAITWAVALTLLFFLMRLTPGDPLARLAADRPLPPDAVTQLRHLYGLDRPLLAQYTSFLSGVVRGDLGLSIQFGIPVRTLIAERLPATVLLGGVVLLIDFTLGLGLGVLQARDRGGRFDRWLGNAALTAYAIPSFWIGLCFVWIGALTWHLFPVAGMSDPLASAAASPWAQWLDIAHHLALPALTLVVATIAVTMRYQRGALLEALDADWIRTARAKGVPESTVLRRHAWRTALGPVITLLGLWLPMLVTGAVFTEAVFAWPGLGSLAADAVIGRDYPLAMGCAALVATLVVVGNLAADLLYAAVDPRVRP